MARGGRRTRSGPAPAPHALKVHSGGKARSATKADRHRARGEGGLPKKPKHLEGYAAELWNCIAPQLEDMRVPEHQDAAALEMLCVAYRDWRECVDDVEEHGRTYETTTESGSVMVRARPEVAMASDAYRRVLAMMAEFGITPASRTKVKAGEIPSANPLEEFIGGSSTGA